MQRNPRLGLEPVAFLDTDRGKAGTRILGVPVMGDRQHLPEIVKQYGVTQAIIAIPSAPGKTIRELVRLCQEINLPVKTMPGMSELLNGTVRVSQLRPVEIGDLLRREPVETAMVEIGKLLTGKRVLVTGAGGSIGSELCRQIAGCAPAEIVLLGHGENSIFDIYNELVRVDRETGIQVDKETGKQVDTETRLASPASSRSFPVGRITFHAVIADIRDECRMQSVFERYQPEIVFHAAVLPSVASMCR